MTNFITAADAGYFTRVCGLIGSIMRKQETPFNITVFDLGLTPNQKKFLNKFIEVHVKQIEKVNINMLSPMRSHMKGGTATVPGLYSWKPALIKQSLEMDENVFYLDAGVTIVRDVSPIVEHVKKTGFFFNRTHTIGWMATGHVTNNLSITKDELYTPGIAAGIQCLNRMVFDNYVVPVYEWAHDIRLFIDDGTAIGGPDAGRHDQTLFSLQASRNNMVPFESNFKFEDKEYNIVTLAEDITEKTLIYHCRGNSDWDGDLAYIKNYDQSLFK